MKTELNNLKEKVIEYKEFKKETLKQIEFFNMKVDEQRSKLGLEDFFKEFEVDNYTKALYLEKIYSFITELVLKLKEENPNYGNKRIVKLLISENKFDDDELLEDLYEKDVKIIALNYCLFYDCGYLKVKEMTKKLNELSEEIDCKEQELIDKKVYTTKKIASKTGNTIVDIVTPYGKIAKSQLDDASKHAKRLVNKGSKQLVKLFKKIEEKTDSKTDEKN